MIVFFGLGTVAWRGVLTGGFWRDGWKRTLARIEAGAGDGYVPTVRVLSRRQVRQIFRDFHSCTVHTNGVMPDDFLIADVLMRRFNRMTLERYLGFVGWYIVARASISRGVSHTDLDPKPMPRISSRV